MAIEKYGLNQILVTRVILIPSKKKKKNISFVKKKMNWIICQNF